MLPFVACKVIPTTHTKCSAVRVCNKNTRSARAFQTSAHQHNLIKSKNVQQHKIALSRSLQLMKNAHKRALQSTRSFTTESNKPTQQPIYLKDYKPPEYLVDSIALNYHLEDEHTIVESKMTISKRDTSSGKDLFLNGGTDMELQKVKVNGKELTSKDYRFQDTDLIISSVPQTGPFTLEITTKIQPHKNKSFSGLYVSNNMYATQCEPEGFRRMTYYLDRPDVMTVFSTTITADKNKYPILLSNGNITKQGDLPNNRHFVTWHDPYKKPSYLFALVAGNLDCLEDNFVTRSGKNVKLRIFVEKGHLDQCQHAMTSLQKAMKWDEDTYNREYDLELFNIVAVSDFNFGAMENKSLNIFNSKYIFANEATATDIDYDNVERVIAHEYFHNWSGNRVTCRDWFQLSLKEGLTVFREQHFMEDMSSAAAKRVSDVNALRSSQFIEDAGPMSHPVRPPSYIEINNFYTTTVYEKGAELIRMMQTILGKEKFKKAIDLYFERHDGTAATCDDFVKCMEDAGGVDLSQFKLWYSQSGTPVINVDCKYDAATQTYSLTMTQSCPNTPGQPADSKKPFHIPVEVALLDQNGNSLPLVEEGDKEVLSSKLLHLKEKTQTFKFHNVPHEPVPSILRGFSAPVSVTVPSLNHNQLAFLAAHDSDPFNRWSSMQEFATNIILDLISKHQKNQPLELSQHFIAAVKNTLNNNELDPLLITQAIVLPGEGFIANKMQQIDPQAIRAVRDFCRQTLASKLKSDLLRVYEKNHLKEPYKHTPLAKGQRAIKTTALGYLMELNDKAIVDLAVAQFSEANNMTDKMAALVLLANTLHPNFASQKAEALSTFLEQNKQHELVVDKWFAVQASSRSVKVNDMESLIQHPLFNASNPNKVYSLIGSFAANMPNFHQPSGVGYKFLADRVINMDGTNPQVAARLANGFSRCAKFDEARKSLMVQQMNRIIETPKLSKNVFEIVSKTLDSVSQKS